MAIPFEGCGYSDHLERAWGKLEELSRTDPKECVSSVSTLIDKSIGFYSDMLEHTGEMSFYAVVYQACSAVDDSPKIISDLFSKAVSHSKNEAFIHAANVVVAEALTEQEEADKASEIMLKINPKLIETDGAKANYHELMTVLITSNVSSALLDEAFTLYNSEHYNVWESKASDRVLVFKSIAFAHLKQNAYDKLEEVLEALTEHVAFSHGMRGLAAYQRGDNERARFYLNSFSTADLSRDVIFDEVVAAYRAVSTTSPKAITEI